MSEAALTASRRRLGAELRRLRETAGKTLDEVAVRLECSPTKISRIETGHVSVRPLDVREMLNLYGVTGARQDALLALIRQKPQKGWWHVYRDVIPEGYEFFIGLEDKATIISDYQPFLVPGLLQTEEYTRAVMEASGVAEADADRRIALRQERRSVLIGQDPPHLHAVIEETVLYRPVGGADVRQRQLNRLADAAIRPNITLQVLPTRVGVHPAEGRAFVILSFADPADPNVVYLEHLGESHLVDDSKKVAPYIQAFESIRALALSPEDSLGMIECLSSMTNDRHLPLP